MAATANTIKDICNTITFGGLTNDQLEEIISAVQYSRAKLARKNKSSLSIGAQVTFVDPRNGRVFNGTVEHIKIKNASVRCNGTLYRVPMNLLSLA